MIEPLQIVPYIFQPLTHLFFQPLTHLFAMAPDLGFQTTRRDLGSIEIFTMQFSVLRTAIRQLSFQGGR
jgi:hypothetical protein